MLWVLRLRPLTGQWRLLQLRLILRLEGSSLRSLRGCLGCLVWWGMSNSESSHKRRRTLTPAPTKANPATTNGETLHLLNGAFGIRLPHELHKPAVLAHRNFHLSAQKASTTKAI